MQQGIQLGMFMTAAVVNDNQSQAQLLKSLFACSAMMVFALLRGVKGV